jgi:phosphoglycolate phosphatase
MLSDYLAAYRVGYLNKTAPYDGVLETVKTLYEQGITMAVVTNKPQEMATNMVKDLFGDVFGGVWGNNPAFPLKPDPAMTLHVMEKLHLAAEETLFVGDSGVDMMTAKNAGLTAVGVSWGFRDREELQTAGADYMINHPKELLDLVLR